MPRLFVGLPVPDAIRSHFPELYRNPPDGVRPTRVSEHHITLHFLGDVENETAEQLKAELETVTANAFGLTLSGAGCFAGRRKKRVVWAGVKPSEELLDLHQRVGDCVESVGLTIEDRPFNPHTTLARVTARAYGLADAVVEHHKDFRMTLRVDDFILYRVHLEADAGRYEAWRRYELTSRSGVD